MKRVVSIERLVLDNVPLAASQAEAFRASLATRLADELRGWSGPAGRGMRAQVDVGEVAAATAADPEALSREVAARVARILKEGG